MHDDPGLALTRARDKAHALAVELASARRLAALHRGTPTGAIKSRLVHSLEPRVAAAQAEVTRLASQVRSSDHLRGLSSDNRGLSSDNRSRPADSVTWSKRCQPISEAESEALAIPDFLKRSATA